MSHIVFIISVISFFLCLFSICTAVLALIAAEHKKSITGKLPLLLAFSLFLFSQVANIYMENVRLIHQGWIYELQEISIVLFTPCIGIFLFSSPGLKQKRAQLYGFLSFGMAAILLYVYGNFINHRVWAFSYSVYGIGAVGAGLYASVVMILRSSGTTFRYRIPGAVSLFLYITLVLFEIDIVFPDSLSRIFLFDIFIIPLLSALWSTVFIVDFISLFSHAKKKNSGMDIAEIAEKFKLSGRELEVTELLLQGRRYHEIGEDLFISKATVKTYINRVYQKLGISSKMELVNKIFSG